MGIRERRLRMIGITRERWPAIRAAGLERYVTARLRRHLPNLPGILLAVVFVNAGLEAEDWSLAALWRQVRNPDFFLALLLSVALVGFFVVLGAALEYRWLDRIWGDDERAA